MQHVWPFCTWASASKGNYPKIQWFVTFGVPPHYLYGLRQNDWTPKMDQKWLVSDPILQILQKPAICIPTPGIASQWKPAGPAGSCGSSHSSAHLGLSVMDGASLSGHRFTSCRGLRRPWLKQLWWLCDDCYVFNWCQCPIRWNCRNCNLVKIMISNRHSDLFFRWQRLRRSRLQDASNIFKCWKCRAS